MVEYGPFYRIESTSQTIEDARKIVASSELWGLPPFGSDVPQAQAYTFPPPGKRYLEFFTKVQPRRGTAWPEVRWDRRDPPPDKRSKDDPGVEDDGEWARIPIRITENTFF